MKPRAQAALAGIALACGLAACSGGKTGKETPGHSSQPEPGPTRQECGTEDLGTSLADLDDYYASLVNDRSLEDPVEIGIYLGRRFPSLNVDALIRCCQAEPNRARVCNRLSFVYDQTRSG